MKKKINFNSFMGKYWLAFVTVAAFIIFSLMEPRFFSPGNLLSICCTACISAVMGMGITFIMAAGELDFSAGVQSSTAGVIVGLLLMNENFNSFLGASIIAILSMMLFGCFNAFIHVKLGLPAFIATFATSYLLKGVFRWITNDKTYNSLSAWPDSFTYLGQGYIFGFIPIIVIALTILSIIAAFYNEKTKWGKYLYALGSNPTACDYLGINASLQKLRGFVLCSLFCAIAGIMQASMSNRVSMMVSGDVNIGAITVVMVGATFLRNGVFNIPGTLLAAFLVEMVDNGLVMANAEAWIRGMVRGIILLSALILVMFFRKKMVQVNPTKTKAK